MTSNPPPRAERRQADRLDCRIPIRLRSGGYTVLAETENLSRTGALLRVPLAELRLPDDASIGAVGSALRDVLGDMASAEFRYDELGGLITRTLRMVRVGRRSREEPWVDIGFALRRPITDEETGFLRLDLPRVRRPAPAAAGQVPEGARSDGQGLQLVVCGGAESVARPLFASAAGLDAAGVGGSLPGVERLAMDRDAPGVISVIGAIADGYTCTPTVVLMKGFRPLWSGDTEIQQVELDPTDGGVGMRFAFSRPLGRVEQSRLGMA
jgi:hypothetical protein